MVSPIVKYTRKGRWVDRGWYLVTEFEKIPSTNFRSAVELAKTHPGFIQLMDERNILIYRNIYREDDLLKFRKLYKLIRNWKGIKLYFRGDEVDYETIENGVQCYIQMKLLQSESKAPGFARMCRHFDADALKTSRSLGYIGCRRSDVGMERDGADSLDAPCWFFFGKLDQHRGYDINKEELENTVIGHLLEYQHCPLIDLESISAFIRQLPNRIDPRKDKEWAYNRDRRTATRVGYYKEPEILPISKDAYRTYLKRKL